MKKTQKKLIGIVISTLLLLFGLSSCETWRQDCTGEIIVENEIPDTTIYVGGEPFIRDVSESPIVFRHTENRTIQIDARSFDVGENGQFIVMIEQEESRNKGELHVIVVKPISEGRATVEVIGEDSCFDYQVTTTFNVTVNDTTTA